jgi:hypothetical protein
MAAPNTFSPSTGQPGHPGWDITFTRLTLAARPRVEACVLDLVRRFQALGLGSHLQVRQTPRGLSTFLALVGRRGLVCIVDLTLVDGMAVGLGPCAALDIRLLDGCGDVVAELVSEGVSEGVAGGLASNARGPALDAAWAAQALPADRLARAATAVYVATLGHFDLLRPVTRPA